MMPKLLPVLLAIAVFLTAVYFSLPFSREIVYKLGIDNDPTTSCCQEEEILQASGEFDEEANLAIFNNQIIDYPKTCLVISHDADFLNTFTQGVLYLDIFSKK